MTRIRKNVTVVLTWCDYKHTFNHTSGNPQERDHFGGLDVAFVGFCQQDIESWGSIKGGEFLDQFQEVN
jgi:hypothetical protein